MRMMKIITLFQHWYKFFKLKQTAVQSMPQKKII